MSATQAWDSIEDVSETLALISDSGKRVTHWQGMIYWDFLGSDFPGIPAHRHVMPAELKCPINLRIFSSIENPRGRPNPENFAWSMAHYRTPTAPRVRGRVVRLMPHIVEEFVSLICADGSQDSLGVRFLGSVDGKRWTYIDDSEPMPKAHQEGCSRTIALVHSATWAFDRSWSVWVGYRNAPSISIPTDAQGVRQLLMLRDGPLSKAGRRRPLLHWVKEHHRRGPRENKAGATLVRQHLRGLERFEAGDLLVTIRPPAEQIRAHNKTKKANAHLHRRKRKRRRAKSR